MRNRGRPIGSRLCQQLGYGSLIKEEKLKEERVNITSHCLKTLKVMKKAVFMEVTL